MVQFKHIIKPSFSTLKRYFNFKRYYGTPDGINLDKSKLQLKYLHHLDFQILQYMYLSSISRKKFFVKVKIRGVTIQ